MMNITAKNKTYRDVSYIKVHWTRTTYVSAASYKIYRTTDSTPGVLGPIVTTLSKVSTVLNDDSIAPNNTYYYTVIAVDSGGTEVERTNKSSGIISPNFNLEGPGAFDSGHNGWTLRLKMGMYKHDDDDYKGSPAIRCLVSGWTPPGSAVFNVQLRKSGEDWVNIPSDTDDFVDEQGLYCIDNDIMDGSISYDTTYYVRLNYSSYYSNTVELHTYQPNSASFPNLLPSASLQAGWYYGTSLGATGDWDRYSYTGETGDNIADIESDTDFICQFRIDLNASSDTITDPENVALSLSAYNDIASDDTRHRLLCVAFTWTPDTGPLSDKLQVYYMRPGDDTWTQAGPSGGFYRDDSGDRTTQFRRVAMIPLSNYTHNNQVLIAFSRIHWHESSSVPHVSDIMVYDLTSVFGGNLGNILDNAYTEHITGNGYGIEPNDVVRMLDHAASVKWWDYNFQDSLEPQFAPIISTSNGNMTVTVNSVYDDYGGMDTTGYSPLTNYNVEYKNWRTKDFSSTTIDPFSTATGDTSPIAVDPGERYVVRYSYTNVEGLTSGYSPTIYTDTPPVPDKMVISSMSRSFDGNHHIYVNWYRPDDPPGAPVTGYKVYFGTDPKNLVEFDEPDETRTYYHFTSPTYVQPNKLYYAQVLAYNSWGNGQKSNRASQMSTTAPSKPVNPYIVMHEDGIVDFHWGYPSDNGGSTITWWDIRYGTSPDSMPYAAQPVTPNSYLLDANAILPGPLSEGGSIAFKVAAATDFDAGVYSDTAVSTFITTTEVVKLRGYANTDGLLNFVFTKRESSNQAEDTYWTVAMGTHYDVLSGTNVFEEIPAGATLTYMQGLLSQPSTYVYDNRWLTSQYPTGEGLTMGWPYFVKSVVITASEDLLGDYLAMKFTMYPADNEFLDVHTFNSTADGTTGGLDGMNSFMIITDYTTDISFYNKTQTYVDGNTNFMYNTATQINWKVNASIIMDNTIPNQDVPKNTHNFSIPVLDGDTLFDLKDRIENGDGGSVLSLEDQLNNYFTISSPFRSIYSANYDGSEPFSVVCTATMISGQTHLKVNIKTMIEQVEHQISAQSLGTNCFYMKTKANTYFVKENIFELRSYEDMYGRNKPGSSTVSGYVKRSYGFKFNLDYITDYTEEENSQIDLTPIPGSSSAMAIGLDVMGSTRTISLRGIRVDNCNMWMFNAPFDYSLNRWEGDTATETGGVMYIGTSNWGWMKFMKAAMGTFQFIDGPYRLIMMTVPSSSMQQYVPDRECKYQYTDGTMIIQAGWEDMCYVMIEKFATGRTEDMYNAITYDLTLRRVVPLGSSP